VNRRKIFQPKSQKIANMFVYIFKNVIGRSQNSEKKSTKIRNYIKMGVKLISEIKRLIFFSSSEKILFSPLGAISENFCRNGRNVETRK